MEKIKCSALLNLPVARVWEVYNSPDHIVYWNAAHESWHCPASTVDLKPEGKFSHRMDARDGSFGFDFSGTFKKIDEHKYIQILLDDERQVEVCFVKLSEEKTEVKISFDAESTSPEEMQKLGWQAILDNFKAYAEAIEA